MKKLVLTLAAFLSGSASVFLWAQPVYTPAIHVPVTVNGALLENPWVGGFNAPIFSEIDLNGDGIKDLFVFDKDGNRITTYINEGTPGQVAYRFAPEYKSKFPYGLHDWVLLKDFDCDGKEDIFAYSYSGGMTVYKNNYSVSNGLSFTLAYTLIMSKFGATTANLYVASVNLPALSDVDYDGDLDVLTFSLAGNFIEYHRNQGKDMFNRCDTLVYEMEQGCWGHFGLSGNFNTAILNVSCFTGGNPPAPDFSSSNLHEMHSGSCMIAVDLDGDFDRDLINGDLLGNNLLQITNGGDSAIANMTAQDTLYPVYNTPVNLITFPSPYYLDINNDGNKDLVVAPCIASGAQENFNNVWMYENTTDNSSNIFSYQENRFLSEEMIETGSGSNVKLFDIDSDGLKDMLIGNFGYFSPTPPFLSEISYYRNTGTAQIPEYELITDDFGGFSSMGLTGLSPTFGDLDGDGDYDLLIGNSDGTLVYYKNTAGAGNFPVYALAQVPLVDAGGSTIDVGQFSAPQLVDVNKDGKIDLLIGEKSGNINYYENIGTPFAQSFSLATTTFGNVMVNNWFNTYGYSYPCLVDSSGLWQLLVGSVTGYIYQYVNIDGNLSGTFNLADSMYYGIYEPHRLTLDVADLNGDGFNDILTGNSAGGVTLYNYGFTGIAEPPPAISEYTIYPNPSDGYLLIRFDTGEQHERSLEITDVMGRTIMKLNTSLSTYVFDLTNTPAGIYTIRVVDGQKQSAKKFIIK